MRIDRPWQASDTREVVAFVSGHRPTMDGFDVAVPGETEPGPAGVALAASHADAGATWWMEAVHPWRYGFEDGDPWPAREMASRIEAGPPGA